MSLSVSWMYIWTEIITSIFPPGDRHGELLKRISAFNMSVNLILKKLIAKKKRESDIKT